MTTSGCDPDNGWIPGVDGTKCYMVLRVGGMEGVMESLVLYLSQDYDFSNCFYNSGDYYYGMTWFEAMSCCYANHGYPAELVSQEEHDLIKNRLVMVDGEDVHTSYWLGGADFFTEGEWRWNSGQAFSFTQWHEGEPNDNENEVR